ncbi:MAG: aldo/keto reductase [Chloroflexi bacterium]|nr:aldo/keto reductase [Chloroflexota bacterium]
MSTTTETTLQRPLLPTRPLGKTGVQVTQLGLGGLYGVAQLSGHEQAVEIINRAIDLGINYIDTASRYGNGASELNIGVVMRQRRDEVFLTSKSHNPTYDGTLALVERSLARLQTDHLDLYQHHFLGQSLHLEQLQTGHSAREAMERLRDEGVIRFIGVTAHSARLLADALEDYAYDTALITLNPAHAVMQDVDHLERFFRVAQARGTGVIAMKVVERGNLVRRGLRMEQLLPWTLSHPVATAIVGVDNIAQLEENVRLARAFSPMSPEAMAALEAEAQAD